MDYWIWNSKSHISKTVESSHVGGFNLTFMWGRGYFFLLIQELVIICSGPDFTKVELAYKVRLNKGCKNEIYLNISLIKYLIFFL